MAKNADHRSVQVQTYLQQLKAAATDLNTVSDELGKPIEVINNEITKLNLGVTTWLSMAGGNYEFAPEYWWSYDIGYAKVGTKWGIALADRSGNATDPESDKEEVWLFNDAPRRFRIIGVDHVPALLEKLVAESKKTVDQVKDKVAIAKELASALRENAGQPKK
jgi:hypothetical protein